MPLVMPCPSDGSPVRLHDAPHSLLRMLIMVQPPHVPRGAVGHIRVPAPAGPAVNGPITAQHFHSAILLRASDFVVLAFHSTCGHGVRSSRGITGRDERAVLKSTIVS